MTQQTCPACGARFEGREAWAKAAVSVLIPAPAVRDLATQVRCPSCRHVFADSEVRHLDAPRFTNARALSLAAFIGVIVWAIYQLL